MNKTLEKQELDELIAYDKGEIEDAIYLEKVEEIEKQEEWDKKQEIIKRIDEMEEARRYGK